VIYSDLTVLIIIINNNNNNNNNFDDGIKWINGLIGLQKFIS